MENYNFEIIIRGSIEGYSLEHVKDSLGYNDSDLESIAFLLEDNASENLKYDIHNYIISIGSDVKEIEIQNYDRYQFTYEIESKLDHSLDIFFKKICNDLMPLLEKKPFTLSRKDYNRAISELINKMESILDAGTTFWSKPNDKFFNEHRADKKELKKSIASTISDMIMKHVDSELKKYLDVRHISLSENTSELNKTQFDEKNTVVSE